MKQQMSMPFITEEVIDSIREQQCIKNKNRSIYDSYLYEIANDVKNENPNLLGTIISTSNKYMCELIELGIDEKSAISFYINIVNFGCSIYECIKQQMVCNNLSEGEC